MGRNSLPNFQKAKISRPFQSKQRWNLSGIFFVRTSLGNFSSTGETGDPEFSEKKNIFIVSKPFQSKEISSFFARTSLVKKKITGEIGTPVTQIGTPVTHSQTPVPGGIPLQPQGGGGGGQKRRGGGGGAPAPPTRAPFPPLGGPPPPPP